MSAAESINLTSLEAEAEHFKKQFSEAREAIGKVIVGQTRTVEAALTAIETRYRAQFTALDSMLSSMQTTQSYLSQQLAAIAANAG